MSRCRTGDVGRECSRQCSEDVFTELREREKGREAEVKRAHLRERERERGEKKTVDQIENSTPEFECYEKFS